MKRTCQLIFASVLLGSVASAANIGLTVPGDAGHPGSFAYPYSNFFPLDDQSFSNTPGESHNYHFLDQVHTSVSFHGGQTLQPDLDIDSGVVESCTFMLLGCGIGMLGVAKKRLCTI